MTAPVWRVSAGLSRKRLSSSIPLAERGVHVAFVASDQPLGLSMYVIGQSHISTLFMEYVVGVCTPPPHVGSAVRTGKN